MAFAYIFSARIVDCYIRDNVTLFFYDNVNNFWFAKLQYLNSDLLIEFCQQHIEMRKREYKPIERWNRYDIHAQSLNLMFILTLICEPVRYDF